MNNSTVTPLDLDRDGFSVAEFARRNDISRTTAYQEISSGRLVARKVRTRTIITREDAMAWRMNLPRATVQLGADTA
jgi:hypothetical protein